MVISDLAAHGWLVGQLSVVESLYEYELPVELSFISLFMDDCALFGFSHSLTYGSSAQ